MTTSNIELKERNKMNWSNLSEKTCPKCERKLSFRLKGSLITTKTRANRSNSCAVKSSVDSNYYFCFMCKFQISEKRMNEIIVSTKEENNEFIRKHGLSSLWSC